MTAMTATSTKMIGPPATMLRRQKIRIEAIHIGERLRPLNQEAVGQLAASIRENGLLHPPMVRFVDDIEIDGELTDSVPVLVAGRHRVEALKLNGAEFVECQVFKVDDVRAELMEISENLHRADLTALERDEQVARYIQLTSATLQTAQDAPIKSKREDGRGHRPESGINAAARELGIERTDAQRAVKVAALSEEAKATARASGLDDNRSAMLAAAREETPEAQVSVLVEKTKAKKEKKEKRPTTMATPADTTDSPDAIEDLRGWIAEFVPVDQRPTLRTFVEELTKAGFLAALDPLQSAPA